MNRKQRRSQEKSNKSDSYQHRIEQKIQADKIMQKIADESKEWARNELTGRFYTVFLLVLRRKYGWGKKRIYRALNEMAAIINDLEDGTIDIMDLKREAEEAGMKITLNANRQIIKVGIFEDEEDSMDCSERR